MQKQTCVIVGGGHAAAQLAPGLRSEGWEGRIVVVTDEAWLPYNRPPLSKTFLAGEKSAESLLIRSPEAYVRANIEVLTNTRVLGIDRDRHRLRLADGESLDWDKLVLATGGRARQLEVPGHELAGVHYLRNIADVERIRPDIVPDGRAVIIGGGYIGLETAAMLRKLGLEVTVLESAECILSRVMAPLMADFFTRVHREEGVAMETCAQVSAIAGEQGRVTEVQCLDGRVFPADLVIAGIGVIPNEELAAEAGLETDNGIVIDACCRTEDPDIFAAGDCASFTSERYQTRLRLESVQNAVDQARVVSANVCGGRNAYNALPWFWSDQYDVKLQIAGLSAGYDQTVLRGDAHEGRKLALFYLREGQVLAVDAVNSPQEFMLGKRLITEGLKVDQKALADPGVPMKQLFA